MHSMASIHPSGVLVANDIMAGYYTRGRALSPHAISSRGDVGGAIIQLHGGNALATTGNMFDRTSLAYLSQTIFALALVKPMKDCLLRLGLTMMFHGPRAFITHEVLSDDTTALGGPDFSVHAAMTRLLEAYSRMGVRDILVVDVGRGFNFALPDDFGPLKALYIRLELFKIQRVSSRMISEREVDSRDEDLVKEWLAKEKNGRKPSHAPKAGCLAGNANLCHAVQLISHRYNRVTSSLRKITPGAADDLNAHPCSPFALEACSCSSFALEACLNEMVEVASTTGDWRAPQLEMELEFSWSRLRAERRRRRNLGASLMKSIVACV